MRYRTIERWQIGQNMPLATISFQNILRARPGDKVGPLGLR
jgi:hypothetical protein